MPLRRATYAGKPLGSNEFQARMEELRKQLMHGQDHARQRFDLGLETSDDNDVVAVLLEWVENRRCE
ncbi:MAG: hypothetical protein IH602_17400 [Bryobacteraceae bacterium]|nr:hypothetical protein [Bryobacteraceae bacterium]